MNNRRDQQYERQQFGRHNAEYDERYRDYEGNAGMQGGRGQDDWRADSQRAGWGRNGGDQERFGGPRGGGMRGGQGQGRFASHEGYGGDWRTEGMGGRPHGYGEGLYGGFSYAEEGMRGQFSPSQGMRGAPMGESQMGQSRWANEGLSNDFSVEGTRSFSRDEQRSNARGYGVGSAFETEGQVRVSHRGKGPKGYKRSDDRIREDASQLLADHHEVDATDIELVVKDGELTLSGTVPDRQTKRLAERVVEGVSGVLDVHNTIRIARAETATSSTQGVQSSRSNGNQVRAQH